MYMYLTDYISSPIWIVFSNKFALLERVRHADFTSRG